MSAWLFAFDGAVTTTGPLSSVIAADG